MSAPWLASGVGVGGTTLTVALLVFVTVGGLPLLTTTLALVASYSPDPDRRAAAEKILDLLLATLRPRGPSTRPPGGAARQRLWGNAGWVVVDFPGVLAGGWR